MLIFEIYTVILSVAFALWEIQIEGKNGWAADLPTWRKKGWIVKLTGGGPWTGYHVYMIVFLLLIFHLPFLFTDWQFRKELLISGLFLEFLLIEDFLWFVLNPHYGVKRFKPGKIWWYSTWWGPVPDCYWWYAAMSGVLIMASRL
ncbi:hypothetical protein HY439_00740 [Candidatus Microgenomates bacterium]|nr:hypothetical protein [Candidatus Microgenomates bacterium]